MTKLCKST